MRCDPLAQSQARDHTIHRLKRSSSLRCYPLAQSQARDHTIHRLKRSISLRCDPLAQSQARDHTINRLKRSRRKRSKRSTIFLEKTREKATSKTSIGSVLQPTLWERLIGGDERIWAFQSTKIPSWTELNRSTKLYNNFVITCVRL